MNKKLMILVAGALTALAFMALAGAASAKETKIKCEGAGKCTFTASGGVTNFSIANGDTVRCESVSGGGEVTPLDAEREGTTSNVQLLFHGCKEQATIFHFACTNTATSGTITTNVMVGHSIALPAAASGAGVLLTNAGVTFTCAGGFASTQVTGSIIGESETKCGENTSTIQKQVFTTTGDGAQKFTTYTGSTFKLEGKTNHSSGGVYETAAQDGTGTLTFNQNVILTCA
ncbi:MAG TPA: hypothetical protein VLK37_11195 [Solirubrobacterales bacterium]|nr:hypothetical protein [Solirubrobacterales bacterium]